MSGLPAVKDLVDENGAPVALDEGGARQLMGAMLDGGLDELELGAVLALMQTRGPTVPELTGYASALSERCFRVDTSLLGGAVIVLPAYRGARAEPNLLPLLAFGLQRLGVPVLVHGALDSGAGVASAYVFRELGVMPCASLAQAQGELERDKLAFVPGGLLAPGLSELLALRTRLGFGWIAHVLARLIDPIAGRSLRVVGADCDAERSLFREFLQMQGGSALLLIGTDGGAFANPRQRPLLEYVHEGSVDTLFEAESRASQHLPAIPQALDAAETAAWTRRALSGEAPLPLPLVNQLASCLYGAGYTHDLNQAKAIVAVETGSLIAA